MGRTDTAIVASASGSKLTTNACIVAPFGGVHSDILRAGPKASSPISQMLTAAHIPCVTTARHLSPCPGMKLTFEIALLCGV